MVRTVEWLCVFHNVPRLFVFLYWIVLLPTMTHRLMLPLRGGHAVICEVTKTFSLSMAQFSLRAQEIKGCQKIMAIKHAILQDIITLVRL